MSEVKLKNWLEWTERKAGGLNTVLNRCWQ
jgi:hypothetical protein